VTRLAATDPETCHVPPEQCPECGRFLARSFVVGLADAPAPCPKCGTELSGDRFGGGATPADVTVDPADVTSDVTTGPTDVTPATDPTAVAAGSVRPPDLSPEQVRDVEDPVAGWDVGVPTELVAVRDERPFPLDTVVVVGAAVLGLGLGAAFGRRPGRDALLCALGGAVGAGLVRRIWQLP
jgi:hypothetical protein